MKKVSGIIAILFAAATILSAQATDLTVKDTPASQALIQAAKEQAVDQAAFNTKLQQARYSLDTSNKAPSDQLTAAQKDLEAKVKSDKKYKPLFDKIAALQKQLTDNNSKAQSDFAKDTGPIQQRVQSESRQIQALLPIVRKESGLPDNATYDPATNKWVVPAAKK
jgi:DNA repair ATPase RecN